MKILRTFLILFAILFIISCSKKIELKQTSIIYSINYDFEPNIISLVNSNENVYAIAYFAFTNKRLEITNLKNEVKKTVKLSENVTGNYLLANNIDSIYIYDNLCRDLHLITSEGFNKTINLSSFFKQENIRFYPPSQICKNSLYISGYSFTPNENMKSSIDFEIQQLREIVQNERIIVFNNLFTDSISVSQMLNKFVSSEIVNDNNYVSTDFLKIQFFKNAIVCFHPNLNVLFLFDKNSGKIVERVQVFSEYANIKSPLIQLYRTEKEKEEFIKQRQEASFLNAIIYDVIFDEFRNLYFITILLPNKDFHYLNNLTFERDWSLIVFNKDFKNLGEFYFQGDDYDFRTILPINEGILIRTKSENYKNEKTEFSLFQIL